MDRTWHRENGLRYTHVDDQDLVANRRHVFVQNRNNKMLLIETIIARLNSKTNTDSGSNVDNAQGQELLDSACLDKDEMSII